ncbi:MAG: serine/threonine protein kinase [Planctomycetes bacterium]|nr:serine/threonine protein kinase [Planctomycetota bacterium]
MTIKDNSMDEYGVKVSDDYPKVYIEATDKPLSEHVYSRGFHYTKFKEIARGGKCLIQSCYDIHLNRIIAHKTLLPEFSSDPLEQKRFLREARVTASLQHPNTIPIYEISRDSRMNYYFTMKMVHGYTLGSIIQKLKENDPIFSAKYTMDTLLGMVVQICNCLNYAHTHGVVHRDIKPENILTGTFGEVIVLDWGLAKVWNMPREEDPTTDAPPISDLTLTAGGKLQATPLYMSPEQIKLNNDVNHASDIYSLGTVLYEMLTCEPVVQGDTMYSVLRDIENGNIIPPRERAPDKGISEALEEICMKCLATEPKDRYSSAAELIEAIRGFRLDKIQL